MFIRSGYSAQTRRTRASATEHHHRGADVLLSLRDLAARQHAQPGGARLGLERRGGEVVEADDVALDAPAAVVFDDLVQALDGHGVALLAQRDGAAGVDPAADLADLGQRRLGVLVV